MDYFAETISSLESDCTGAAKVKVCIEQLMASMASTRSTVERANLVRLVSHCFEETMLHLQHRTFVNVQFWLWPCPPDMAAAHGGYVMLVAAKHNFTAKVSRFMA